jgi:hypothetical protein
VAIIWPYLSSASTYVSAGQQVVVPPQRCPTCLRQLVGWGGYWRWLRAPLLVERIWIRRGRCSACRRSHALLPDLLLVRRLDVVAAIPFIVGRHVHRQVPQAQPPAPPPSTGIDYLGLVVAEHDDHLLGQIAYRDLPRATGQDRRS